MAIRRNINYLNKTFTDYRSQLINYSQTYFPNTYTDFTETSPGMMFIEQAAYIGDVLSFYLDNQIQENFLQFARQTSNLYDLSYMYGYTPKVTGLANVELSVYQLVPSIASGSGGDTLYVPDYSYALYLGENTVCSTADNIDFTIEDPIDFTVSNSLDLTEVTVAQISGNEPTYYLLKKTRNAISGTSKTQTFSFGAPEEFPTVVINDSNIGSVLSCYDTEGFRWYEVDHLGQELIFENKKNTNTNDPNNFVDSNDAPYLLQTRQVQRRFTTRFLSPTQLQIQFGAGNPNDTDEEIIPNPMNVGLGLPFEKDKLTTAYSPTNFIFSNTYGIAPTGQTLTFTYLVGGGVASNVDANTITNINNSTARFQKQSLNSNVAQTVFNSLQVNNLVAATGGSGGDTAEQIRQNSISNFPTQLRSVTSDDYLVRALSLPPKFGIISKAYTEKPKVYQNSYLTNNKFNDQKTTLCLYVLSQDINGNLVNASKTLKNNLKTYINQYRMIGDSIDIKDAFVINIGVNFEIVTLPNFNNNRVLANCVNEVKNIFDISKWQINQPIILADISARLMVVDGVQSINSITISNKAGTESGYSKYAYDTAGALQNGTIFPSIDPSIFEVKYLDQDIVGRVVTVGQSGGSSAAGGGTY